jgi:3-deoxy-D-manno-octulosonic-acid transferase
MAIKEIITPVKERKTEYYALYEDQLLNHEDSVWIHGPFASVGELESSLSHEDPSKWVIVTKVKKVVVS